jgi:ribonuclease PH
MATRVDGRRLDQLRPIKITRDFIGSAIGSALIEWGRTRVICTAVVEEDVPVFRKDSGLGWVTAEYAMLPASTNTRKPRERFGRVDGRTMEIQRIIGRAARMCIDMELVGERTIWLDCDVIEADGGTRAAAVTGSFVALADAAAFITKQGIVLKNPVMRAVGAVSVGIVGEAPVLDLCYSEDSKAAADMNLAMTDDGRIVEIQSTAERRPLTEADLAGMLELGKAGVRQVLEIQKAALGETRTCGR